MTDVSADQIARELRLNPEQMLTLRALQTRMLRHDWEQEHKNDTRNKKQDRLQRSVAAGIDETIRSLHSTLPHTISPLYARPTSTR